MCTSFDAGGDIETLRDQLHSLTDKLKEGDVDENVRHLRKIEKLSKSAIEDMEAKTETGMPVVDVKRRLPSPAPPESGTAEGSKVIKTEPGSPSTMTSVEETPLSKLSNSTFILTIVHSMRCLLFIHSHVYGKEGTFYRSDVCFYGRRYVIMRTCTLCEDAACSCMCASIYSKVSPQLYVQLMLISV